MHRTDVTFPSGDGACAAWLYEPDAASGSSGSVIVMGHGLGGVKEMRLDAFAERFCAAGYRCLVFDYRHFGTSSGEPRQLLKVDRQLQDWRSAVKYARRLEGVDPDRVVAWGTSMGGGHAIRIAAEDSDLAAAIAQCPFTDGLATSLTAPPLTSIKLAVLGARDLMGAARKREPVLVPTYGPPGSVALMTSPDAVAGVEALLPKDQAVRSEVAARFVFDVIREFPGRYAAKVSCPILFVVCERDAVAPVKATLRHVAKARAGEIEVLPAGHFDIYRGALFEANIDRQLAFLAEHSPSGGV